MMSPNKNKRGVVAPVREASPEAGPSTAKPCESNLSSDVEENVPKKGGSSQYGASLLRSLGLGGQKKPAELFRKDLISAMKLADKDALPEESYFLIADPWRQEWEKGVQVPVNVTDIKHVTVGEIHEKSKTGDFKMHHKMLHERVDEMYKKGQHLLTGMPELTEQVVRYDLDDLDVCWLEELNFRFREMGLKQVTEWHMERVLEALENECHKNMAEVMKTAEGVGIEYDEDVVCDVCRSPESEESNEMVFCDKCDICIHQACYGIKTIPQGTWMCRTCALGVKPTCLLCPNMEGAMKCTRSGTQWVHVSCALWIPEVGFGDPDKMEPVTQISQIPANRWSLTCCLCKEREGACIQCSVKSCKTAFHVTCAYNEGLHMSTILDDKGDSDDVNLKAFCPKHSKRWERSHSESELDTPRKKSSSRSPRKNSPRKDSLSSPRKEMTQEERASLRLKKLKVLEEEFYKEVDVSAVSKALQLEEKMVDVLFVYWKLKRKCNWDRALLTPKTEEEDILEKQEGNSRAARRKMFVHLRHDLERARNLCYMISKREKMKRQLFHNKEHVFKNMARVLKNKSLHLSKANVRDIVKNYHFDSIYDDYGRSVQKLPGELSEEDEQSSELDDTASASTISTEIAETTAGAARRKTAVKTLFSSEAASDSTPKLGQSRKGHHKTKRKGGKAKKTKELENQALASASEVSASPLKSKGVFPDDDNIQIVSADESEDETVRRLPGAMAYRHLKAVKGAPCSNINTPSVMPRRVRQKKSRRGRKPWYEKQSQRFELTPNLALSTDDDEDTKGSCSGELRDSQSASKREACDEHAVVDVVGEGEAEKKSVPSSGGEVNIGRRRVGRPKKTQSDGVQVRAQTSSDPRTKGRGKVASKCDRTWKKSENTDVESVKGLEVAASGVSPSFPSTRTSNRKRRNLEKVVPNAGSTVSKVEGSLHDKSDDAMKVRANAKMASSSEAERIPSLSPAKIRKSSRGHARREKVEKDKTPDIEEVRALKAGKHPPLPHISQPDTVLLSPKFQGVKTDTVLLSPKFQGVKTDTVLLSPKLQGVKTDTVLLSPKFQGVKTDTVLLSPKFQGVKTDTVLLSPKFQGVKTELPSDSTQSSGESKPQWGTWEETGDCVEAGEEQKAGQQERGRKGRQSSLRARLLWNRLLVGAGRKARKTKQPGPRNKSSQPQSQTSSSAGQSTRSAEDKSTRSAEDKSTRSAGDKSTSGMKIKQEKDAENPPQSDSVGKERDLKRKPHSSHSVDLQGNNSKHALLLASAEDMYERVKNGCRKRHSRLGKRKSLANGVLDGKQRKINAFFSKVTVKNLTSEELDMRSMDMSSSIKRVLNEISPEKRGSWQNSHVGSGSPARDSVGKPSNEQLSERDRVPDSPPRFHHQGGEGSGEGSDLMKKKTDYPSGAKKELDDDASAFSKGRCETDQFSMDTLRAFRSQSPSSEASTVTGVRLDSREGTPRRFTRSQTADRATENFPRPKDADSASDRRTKLRGHRLKASKASS